MNEEKLLTFKDNKGRTVKLSDKLTVTDLVKMGIEIKLRPREAPLPDNWYAHPPKPDPEHT